MALMEVRALSKRFGGLVALNKVSFEVKDHEILGLIGPNGAGKTTLFQVITGLTRPSEGEVHFRGARIDGLPPHRVARAGIARTFQIMRIFPQMSVLENVMVARHRHAGAWLIDILLQTRKARDEEAQIRARSLELLEFLGLSQRARELAGILPPGQQRLVEIARSLATDPALLLLDEPSAGLNPQESDRLSVVIRRIREEFRIAIILIEHHMRLLMGVSDRVVVLNYGSKIAEGTPAEIRSNADVIRAYLGRGAANA